MRLVLTTRGANDDCKEGFNAPKKIIFLFLGFLLTFFLAGSVSAKASPPVFSTDKHSCDPDETPDLMDTRIISATEPAPITVNLPDDGEYLFEAVGTYVTFIGRGDTADAAYANVENNWGLIQTNIGSYGSPFRGVTSLISDMGGGTIGIIEWGDYNPSHIYGFLYDVISPDVQFVISDWYDTWYIWDYSSITNDQVGMSDDDGSLTLNIYKCIADNGSNTDADGDGYFAETDDCNDTDSSINPGASDSVCDGIDNNCNDLIDENYVNSPSTCGVGECLSEGEITCVDGSEVDTCTEGDATDEICDGLDNNCNGETDEDLTATPSTCGFGICASEGVITCVDGSGVDSCTPGTPTDEVCDGLDNNCDGETDEAFPDLGNSCFAGVGACERVGSYICAGDKLSTVCDAIPGNPISETCNGSDDDCDGITDEDLIEDSEITLGQCFGNTKYCDNGDWLASESNYEPIDEVCNGSDDDCDGQIDEDKVCSYSCEQTEPDNTTYMLGLMLGTNRWIYNGANWITIKPPKSKGNMQFSPSIEDTNNCSCHQILEWMHDVKGVEGEMKGLWKYGCSEGIIKDFIKIQSNSVFFAQNYFTIFVR